MYGLDVPPAVAVGLLIELGVMDALADGDPLADGDALGEVIRCGLCLPFCQP
jgi:hypothetical protein